MELRALTSGRLREKVPPLEKNRVGMGLIRGLWAVPCEGARGAAGGGRGGGGRGL